MSNISIRPGTPTLKGEWDKPKKSMQAMLLLSLTFPASFAFLFFTLIVNQPAIVPFAGSSLITQPETGIGVKALIVIFGCFPYATGLADGFFNPFYTVALTARCIANYVDFTKK